MYNNKDRNQSAHTMYMQSDVCRLSILSDCFIYFVSKTIIYQPVLLSRVRSSAGSVCCFLEQETFTPQKVLVIPRNRWLRLNMTEKLFTGTLNKNQNKTKLCLAYMCKHHVNVFFPR